LAAEGNGLAFAPKVPAQWLIYCDVFQPDDSPAQTHPKVPAQWLIYCDATRVECPIQAAAPKVPAQWLIYCDPGRRAGPGRHHPPKVPAQWLIYCDKQPATDSSRPLTESACAVADLLRHEYARSASRKNHCRKYLRSG